MKSLRIAIGTYLLFMLAPINFAQGDIVVFNDETSYLNTLASLDYQSVYEGFEDDSVWGSVRTTIPGGPQTAPSITNHGITWTANTNNSEVTTGNGAARTGNWGFFTLPHGDPPTIGDGLIGTSDSPIFGVGGWIETNTPPAGISLWLDIGLPGQLEVDFQGNDVLGTAHAFFGVINTDGFTRFDYLETEFDIDEQKLIFADDFIFAVASIFELGDVNRDGTVDLLDVAPFIDLLSTGEFQFEADINQDGVVDLLDVQPFVDLLTG